MLSYIFKAKNRDGALVAGTMQADRRETVVSALKQKGYYLLGVEPQHRLTRLLDIKAALRARVRVRDKAVFTHQLATLLKAGVRLSIALDTLTRQTQNKYLAAIVRQLHDGIEQSASLSQALAKHPRVFSAVYIAVVEAAEQSGSLPETLAVLSDQLKAAASINARIKTAMTYPIFLLLVSAAVVAVLTTFVIPKFVRLFVNAGQKLPLPTKILLAAAAGLKQFWWMLLVALVAFITLFIAALNDKNLRLRLDAWLLTIPVAGPLNQKIQMARFTRTLGSLLNGGVRIVEAVTTTKGVTSNRAFAAQIHNIEQDLLKGLTLTDAVRRQKHFTEISANLIAVGEDTGTLPEMLIELAQMYDQHCENAISSMTNLLGPALIVILGLVIGFIVMAVLLPIFETSTMVT